jgi:hypothetical protein
LAITAISLTWPWLCMIAAISSAFTCERGATRRRRGARGQWPEGVDMISAADAFGGQRRMANGRPRALQAHGREVLPSRASPRPRQPRAHTSSGSGPASGAQGRQSGGWQA